MGQKFIPIILPFKPANWILFTFSLTIILGEFFLLFSKQNLPPFLPLWYSKPWGLGRLATPETLFVIPSLSLVFLITNHYLANLFKSGNLALSKILVWTALVTAITGLITIYKILLIP
jgi:hypothetical protein